MIDLEEINDTCKSLGMFALDCFDWMDEQDFNNLDEISARLLAWCVENMGKEQE